MNKKGHNPELNLERKKTAWNMRLSGHTYLEIGEALGISRQAACQLLQKLREDYYKEFMENVDEVKQEQVALLTRAAHDAWDSWERSKDCGPGPDGKYNQFGDKGYISTYLECLSEIRKILGADAAVKLQLDVDVSQWSEEDLRRLLAAESPSSFAASRATKG